LTVGHPVIADRDLKKREEKHSREVAQWLASQAKKQVLGLDRSTAESSGLVSGEKETTASRVIVALEHQLKFMTRSP
jgi:hypothetical protein